MALPNPQREIVIEHRRLTEKCHSEKINKTVISDPGEPAITGEVEGLGAFEESHIKPELLDMIGTDVDDGDDDTESRAGWPHKASCLGGTFQDGRVAEVPKRAQKRRGGIEQAVYELCMAGAADRSYEDHSQLYESVAQYTLGQTASVGGHWAVGAQGSVGGSRLQLPLAIKNPFIAENMLSGGSDLGPDPLANELAAPLWEGAFEKQGAESALVCYSDPHQTSFNMGGKVVGYEAPGERFTVELMDVKSV
ncbi:hypothetical protein HOY82DRAFT_611779 [Tuber indicum]|nr:hypothetical protein HOY82DRAFT_611779 [Tuber indicum]